MHLFRVLIVLLYVRPRLKQLEKPGQLFFSKQLLNST